MGHLSFCPWTTYSVSYRTGRHDHPLRYEQAITGLLQQATASVWLQDDTDNIEDAWICSSLVRVRGSLALFKLIDIQQPSGT